MLLARFGSLVDDVTVAVLLIAVPAAVPDGTFRTTVKLDDPAAKLALVQLIAPVPPEAGVVQDQPVGTVIELNVVLAGVVSVRLALLAVLGPALVTTWV